MPDATVAADEAPDYTGAQADGGGIRPQLMCPTPDGGDGVSGEQHLIRVLVMNAEIEMLADGKRALPASVWPERLWARSGKAQALFGWAPNR